MKKIFGFAFVLATLLLGGVSVNAQLNSYRRIPSNENAGFIPQSVSSTVSSSRQTIYSYAHKGQYKNLKQFLSKGNDIEALDYNGNTPLCEAVWRRDKLAVHTLIFAGANTSADCVRKIPQVYRNFVEFPAVSEDVSAHPVAISSKNNLKFSNTPKFMFGTSYAPYAKGEDWPMEEWESDLIRMKEPYGDDFTFYKQKELNYIINEYK